MLTNLFSAVKSATENFIYGLVCTLYCMPISLLQIIFEPLDQS